MADSAAELERLQRDLAPIVVRLTESSSQAVLVAGQSLEAVVTSTREHYGRMQQELQQLDADVQSTVRQAVQGQGTALETLGTELGGTLEARRVLLERCTALVSELGREANHLAEIAGVSKILTLLARVETAHIGADGERFQSTVDEMAALDRATRKLTRDLVRLQEQMRTALPIFVDGTAELTALNDRSQAALGDSLERVRGASSELQAEAGSAAERAVADGDRLRDASLDALSKLMFQDPLVQNLQQLDVQIGRVAAQVGGRPRGAAGGAVYAANMGMDAFEGDCGEDAAAGDVLLFDDEPEPEPPTAEAETELGAGEMLLF